MSARTGISWTDRTWNPVVGCTKVSQGCKHCYAKVLHDMRHKAFKAGSLQNIPQYREPFETVQTLYDRIEDPLGWRKPCRVFVNSMSDLFHEDVPDGFIFDVFSTMAHAPRHTFQILTKRPVRMYRWFTEYLPEACSGERPAETWPLPNVWLGVSVENQAAADERIPLLLQTPAAIRFLSCEPLLGLLDLTRLHGDGNATWRDALSGRVHTGPATIRSSRIDWVIAGGESGKGARPMHPDWARSLRDQCTEAGVSFHFKQWGDWVTTYDRDVEDPDWRRSDEAAEATRRGRWLNLAGGEGFHGERVVRVNPVGVKRAGRELDGQRWHQFPEVRP